MRFAENLFLLLVPLVIGSVLSGAVITFSPWSKRWVLRRRVGVASGIVFLMLCLISIIEREMR